MRNWAIHFTVLLGYLLVFVSCFLSPCQMSTLELLSDISWAGNKYVNGWPSLSPVQTSHFVVGPLHGIFLARNILVSYFHSCYSIYAHLVSMFSSCILSLLYQAQIGCGLCFYAMLCFFRWGFPLSFPFCHTTLTGLRIINRSQPPFLLLKCIRLTLSPV